MIWMSSSLQNVLILLLVLLFSMSIHELMHALTSNWLGDDTARLQGRISLNPLRHIDPLLTVAIPLFLLVSGSPFLFGAAKPVQVNFNRLHYGEWGGALVGMIGPITNLAIASIAGLLFSAFNPQFGTVIYEVFALTISLNVGLFVFNSIPWPPLDGSRLLYALVPQPIKEFMESIEHSGLMSLAIFILLFYQFGGPIQSLMGKLVHTLAPGLVL
ncbi:hypothetical protein BVY00_02115 [bacterium G20]|nr:hypothetical protein BVY00_02115 [bacterium G20]